MNDSPLLASLRAQPRNLLHQETPSYGVGDGGSLSAMRLKSGEKIQFGEVFLPFSKSESNRALMIAAYGGFPSDFQNLSDSNDTQVLIQALNNSTRACHSEDFKGIDTLSPSSFGMTYLQNLKGIYARVVDVKDCGTAARFMTTYLACHEGTWLLTGTERMKQRPIKPLVDALLALGADIQYAENEGCLPLLIKGNQIVGGKAAVDMNQSSQFASSLLLAAPMLPQGLELELLGDAASLPYLDMTIHMMRHFSAQVERRGRTVIVKPQPYQEQPFVVEADWTAASYWYEMAAFSEECEIRLRGLSGPSTGSGTTSLQGDAIIAEWMKSFGVCTTPCDDGIILTKKPFERKKLSFDFTNCPDLYPTMAATCAGLQVEAEFTGIENLHHKESDRVESMRMELAKLGSQPLNFCGHNDHRVVMALAPLALLYGPVSFDHPEVVRKSYPRFWDDAAFLLVR